MAEMVISRTFLRIGLIVALGAATVLPTYVQRADGASAAASAAASCTLSSHCYAIADWFNTPSTHGSGGTLTSHCLYNGGAPNYFTTQEIWQDTDNASNFQYWVEGGAIYGYDVATRHWFWADNRPNGGGFNIHFPALSFSLNTSYGIGFTYIGNNEWDVTVGSQHVGYSTANPPSGLALEAGTEMTTTDVRSVGKISNLSWTNTSGVVTNGWSGAGVHGGGPATASMNSSKTEVDWSTPC